MFAKIDKEDRTAPQITKQHAIDFKKCSDLIVILTMFGPMEQEWQEREKYCKFKAGIILKCIKSGEEPPRGNPFAKEEEKPVEQVQQENGYDSNEMSYEGQGKPYEEIKENFGYGGAPSLNNYMAGGTPGGNFPAY